MLDRASFPRDKVCGDAITSQTLDLIENLGAAEVTDGYPPVTSLQLVSPGGEVVSRPLARPAYTVPRYVLDNRLLDMALACGTEFRQHKVRQLDVQSDHVELDGMISARVVIGADGASSVVRRAMGVDTNPPQHLAIAIRGYAPAPSGPPMQRVVMSSTRWPAYAWLFPIGDGRANVGYGEALVGTPLTRAYLLDRLATMLPRVNVAATTDLRSHLLPLATWRPAPGVGRLLLTGDACSLINPFSGEGIFYAVLSGGLAGTAAVDALAVADGADATDLYARALDHALGAHFRSISRSTRFVRHGWLVDGAVRAACTSQQVFDSMLGFGLGNGITRPTTTLRIAFGVARSASRRLAPASIDWSEIRRDHHY